MPTRARAKPSPRATRPRTIESATTAEIATKANTASAKYSAGPKTFASSTMYGAKNTTSTHAIVPPMNAPIAEVPSAFAALPLLAMRWPSNVVAIAEEWFLRGALYDAVSRVAGDNVAIGVGALAFGLLHLPLYGWGAVPLDLAVGVLLGELRRVSGTPAAPAVTHVGADLVAWFLR